MIIRTNNKYICEVVFENPEEFRKTLLTYLQAVIGRYGMSYFNLENINSIDFYEIGVVDITKIILNLTDLNTPKKIYNLIMSIFYPEGYNPNQRPAQTPNRDFDKIADLILQKIPFPIALDGLSLYFGIFMQGYRNLGNLKDQINRYLPSKSKIHIKRDMINSTLYYRDISVSEMLPLEFFHKNYAFDVDTSALNQAIIKLVEQSVLESSTQLKIEFPLKNNSENAKIEDAQYIITNDGVYQLKLEKLKNSKSLKELYTEIYKSVSDVYIATINQMQETLQTEKNKMKQEIDKVRTEALNNALKSIIKLSQMGYQLYDTKFYKLFYLFPHIITNTVADGSLDIIEIEDKYFRFFNVENVDIETAYLEHIEAGAGVSRHGNIYTLSSEERNYSDSNYSSLYYAGGIVCLGDLKGENLIKIASNFTSLMNNMNISSMYENDYSTMAKYLYKYYIMEKNHVFDFEDIDKTTQNSNKVNISVWGVDDEL